MQDFHVVYPVFFVKWAFFNPIQKLAVEIPIKMIYYNFR